MIYCLLCFNDKNIHKIINFIPDCLHDKKKLIWMYCLPCSNEKYIYIYINMDGILFTVIK